MSGSLSDIILIGPVRAGKSTLGRLLFMTSGRYEAMARHVVYTHGRRPEETRDEISALAALPP